MSEKAKARKLEDRNSKPMRSLPPAMGPGMVPHHNYGMPPDNYHTGGRLSYRPPLGQLMGQSLPMGPGLARVPLTNDMGPPIFMPSLNLGTPKLPATGNMTHPPSSHPNSKLKQPNMSSAAAFMTDILTYPQAPPLSAFHSAQPYMASPSCSSLNPAPSAPSTSVAKPTPMVHPMAPVTKVVTMERDVSQPAFSTGGGGKLMAKPSQGVAKSLANSSEGGATGGMKGEGLATMFSQGYYPQVLNSPQVANSLSKMLMSPSPPHPHPDQATSSSGSAVSKPGGAYSGDAFSVCSPGMVAVPTLATSGQPSSNVTFADTTRLDRPPQPSAPHPPMSGSSAAPRELTQQGKDKMSTAEVAANMIISNPGLTGKHIAAMNNYQPPSSSLLPNSTYSSPIASDGSNMLNQHMETGWGFPPQHNFQNALPLPVSMANAEGGVGQDVPNQQCSIAGRPELGVPPGAPQSPQGARSGVGQPTSVGEPGMLCSPGQLNSSPRPRILRGKRPLDGNWKLDGQSNSMHSPASSPHRTKLQAGLKKAIASPLSGVGDQPPSPEATSRPLNHVGSRIEDISASPRKKPRKQNVVANDDQYASNVPDTLQQLIHQQHPSEDGDMPEEKLSDGVGKSPPEKPVQQIRYLSQLRKCPYPINGVYKLRHQVAHNHFRRYGDIKHKSPLPISVYDVANDRSSHHRASGWKLFHFNSQLEEVDKVESDCLSLMEEVRDTLGTVMEDSSCMLDWKALTTTVELIQGNIDRCNRVKYHVESSTANMLMVLDQRTHVVDVLDRYSNFKSHYSSISPSLSSSSSSHHRSQS